MVTLESGTERYDVVATLGKGTFGEVAKSWRRSTGELVAIKMLRADGPRGRVARNELRLLRAVGALDADAAHVVRFLDAFRAGARCCLVFELLERNLFDFQKAHGFAPLPARHIRSIAAQLLTALARLRELAIVHADLKPENVMLVDHARHPFRVKLIDFGSASILSEVRSVPEPYIQSRFYRAPEILLGLPFGEEVDVWSLGCVLAELHLGWPLYPGGSEYDQVRYIVETQGPPRGALLRAARKAPRFFRRAPGAWLLKTPAEHLAESREKPLERRKYVLRSLDQLETLNNGAGGGGGAEALAERADVRAMVQLVKRMLEWDARERIAPAAALRHPFVALRPLRAAHRNTRYYRLCRECLRAARAGDGDDDGDDEDDEEEEEEVARCGVQGAIAQFDHLSLAEVAPASGTAPVSAPVSAPVPLPVAAPIAAPIVAPIAAPIAVPIAVPVAVPVPAPVPVPIPAHYGAWHRPRRHARRPKADAVLGNLIVLGPRSPRGDGERSPGPPPPPTHVQRSLAEWRIPEVAAWPGMDPSAPAPAPAPVPGRYLQHVAGPR